MILFREKIFEKQFWILGKQKTFHFNCSIIYWSKKVCCEMFSLHWLFWKKCLHDYLNKVQIISNSIKYNAKATGNCSHFDLRLLLVYFWLLIKNRFFENFPSFFISFCNSNLFYYIFSLRVVWSWNQTLWILSFAIFVSFDQHNIRVLRCNLIKVL